MGCIESKQQKEQRIQQQQLQQLRNNNKKWPKEVQYQNLKQYTQDKFIWIYLNDQKMGDNEVLQLSEELKLLTNLIGLKLNLQKCYQFTGPTLTIDYGQYHNRDQLLHQFVGNNLQNIKHQDQQQDSNNQFGIGEKGVQSLFIALKCLTSLDILILDLGNNETIGEQGALQLSEGLKCLPKLVEINLRVSNNQLGDKALSSLSEGFKSLQQLESITLKLDENQIGDIGFSSLSEGLKNKNFLYYLELSLDDNKIGDAGLQSFSETLKSLNQISEISLFFGKNQIGEQGVLSLQQGLPHLTNVSYIYMCFLRNLSVRQEELTSLLQELQKCQEQKKLKNLQSVKLDITRGNSANVAQMKRQLGPSSVFRVENI